MPDFGPAELAIILVVVVLIFGSQRLGELGGSLGKGIKDFRKELKDDSDVTPATTTTTATLPPPATVVTTAAAAQPVVSAPGVICANCDSENAPSAVFCSECGKPLRATPTA